MKCKVLFFALFLPWMVNAQNLVPNWSFEEYEECPDGMAQIEKASGWKSFRLTPDYFNACDESGQVGVPNSVLAESISAIDGDAYAGFIRNHNTGNSEVLGISLTESLFVDSIYYLSFYVNRILYSSSFGVTDCWIDRIGARFSTILYKDWPEEVAIPIDNHAQVYHDEMLESHGVWTKIEGYFQADSAYNYVGIGYHFDEDSMNIACDGDPFPLITYFFLDCVCVSNDPETCPNCDVVSTTPHENTTLKVEVYPNPFDEQIIIETSINRPRLNQIRLFSADGRMALEKVVQKQELVVLKNLKNLKGGFYILVVEFENGSNQRIKLIKK